MNIPRIIANSNTFKDSLEINIEGNNNEKVFYRTSSDLDFKIYKSSFYLNETDTIFCYSQLGEKVSKVESAYFLKFTQKRTIKLETSFNVLCRYACNTTPI